MSWHLLIAWEIIALLMTVEATLLLELFVLIFGVGLDDA